VGVIGYDCLGFGATGGLHLYYGPNHYVCYRERGYVCYRLLSRLAFYFEMKEYLANLESSRGPQVGQIFSAHLLKKARGILHEGAALFYGGAPRRRCVGAPRAGGAGNLNYF
jgi:hypothetical protein